MTAGASALAAAQFVGPRRSVAAAAPLAAGSPSSHHAEHQPPNLVSIMIGTGLVWATWLAFNGGSVAAGVSASAAWVFINTQAAAAAGGLTWTLLDALAPGGRGRPSALGACLGVVAGLVCITPAAVFVAPWAAVLMGAAGATACRAAVAALRAASAAGRVPDDACEVFAVHGTGGLVGNSLTALFAAQQLGGTVVVPNLAAQFALHAAVSGAAVAWAYGATWAVLAALDAVLPGGVRVPAADEDAGLDASLHGETAAQQPPPAPAAAPAAVAGNGNGAAAPAGLKQPLAV